MRSARRLPFPLLALGLLGACGSLDNAPFQAGTVHGRLTRFDPAVAVVSLVGAPDVWSTVDADGRFTLEDVPAGPAELFVVATRDTAARVPLTVQGGQSVQVEDVTARPAATLAVKVRARGNLKVKQGRASVVGTPLQALLLDDDAARAVGPLPDGCYDVSVSAPGFTGAKGPGCVASGEKKPLFLELVPEEAYAQRGCAETGCDNDSHCAPNGRCVECLEDAHCDSPRVCRGFHCQ
jgi:hypothetical protein